MAHPVIWSSRAFFYPIGNTPATSLTENLPPEEDAVVLALGCGDCRNVLYTIDLEDKHPLKRGLDITLCDLEPAVLARNVFIYTLLIDQSDEDTIQRLWKIYLDVFIDEASAELVISHSTKLLDLTSDTERWNAHPYGGLIKFCTADTVTALRRLWNKYVTSAQVMKNLKLRIHEEMKSMFNEKVGDGGVTTAMRSAGIMAVDMVRFAHDHFNHYWAHGVTDTKASELKQATHVNPTLLYSSSGDRFNLHYGTDPIMCFHLASALAAVQDNPVTPAKSIVAIVTVIKAQFASWCRSFHRRTNMPGEPTTVKLQLRFCVGNAMSFCKAALSITQGGDLCTTEYISPWGASTVMLSDDYAQSATPRAPLSFNVIDTSNLADHLGFLNILLVTSPLLIRDASSVLFTHSLVGSKGIDGQTTSALDDIGVDLPLLAALLGLVPDRATSEFTSHCMSAEALLNSLAESHQLLELNAWRVVSQREPAMGYSIASDPARLAEALFETYLKLFPDEGTTALGGFLQGGKSPLKHYVRDSFVYFLTLVKACYAGDWQEVMARVMWSVETDRTLIVGRNNYQDFIRGLQLAELWDNMPDPNSFIPSPRNFVFPGWKDIPSVVTIVMAIPRAKIQDLIDDTVNSQIRTPCIQCEILCPGGQNAFSTFQPAFGKIEETGTGPSKVVAIQEDPAGWTGESDLIVHFPVPAWILVKWPAEQYKISLAMFPNMASSTYYSRKLGLHLSIYSTTLADSKRAFILRDRPRATSQAISQHGNLSTPPAILTFPGITDRQLVTLAFDNNKVSSATIRCSVTDERVAATLALKSTQVNAKPLSNSTVQCTFPGFTSTLVFPYPVDGSALKTRIARKSSYVEIEARITRVAKASWKHDPFPVIRTRAGGLFQSRMHYLTLGALPALRDTINSGGSSDWLSPHLGVSLNEEKAKAQASGQPNSGLLELKESLSNIYVRCLESNYGGPTLFKLTDPGEFGTFAILFVSTLRIDLTGSTVVADACILTLTHEAMDNPSLNRALSDIVGQRMASVDVITPAEEIKWWKLYIPTAVERCRTWKHGKSCEYIGDGVPRSLKMGTDPICTCGRGKDLGSFTNVEAWAPFKPFVTRLALGMPFPMSLLGGAASKIRNAVDADVANDSFLSPGDGGLRDDNTCLACGKPGKPKLLVCSACKSARYCSATCQKGHWKRHKASCLRK